MQNTLVTKLVKMETAESQAELLEALLKWMASFQVAAGKCQDDERHGMNFPPQLIL